MHSSSSERKMIVWILCLIFSLSHPILIFASSPTKHICVIQTKGMLYIWEFKSEFHLNRTAANVKTQGWRNNNADCCSWDGITCDPKTGNVVELNLLGSSLNGPLRSNSTLFRLQHLQNLDLSSNNLAGILPDSMAQYSLPGPGRWRKLSKQNIRLKVKIKRNIRCLAQYILESFHRITLLVGLKCHRVYTLQITNRKGLLELALQTIASLWF